MTFLPYVRLVLLAALFTSTEFATAAERVVDRSALARLATLPHGSTQTLDGFPVSPTKTASIRFERVQIYSDDAHLYLITAAGRNEVPRSNHIFLRGYSDDGSARVAMSLNPDASFAEGNGSGPEGSFMLHGDVESSGASRLVANSLESELPPDFKLDFRCGNEFENLDVHRQINIAQQLGLDSVGTAAVTSTHALRLATVAVDTDSLFMSKLFSNNTTGAGNWIASMFNTMNTMYERDLRVGLLQGTTKLRISSTTDPYTSASDVPADGTDLGIFGTYWQNNYSSGANKVTRAFATLLSGRGPCDMNGCRASGIAWIDSYCQTVSNGGSYSVVQVFSSLSIDPNGAIAARLLGHELGHNFGAWHTHCTNVTSGLAPVATSTIDQCYNAEGSFGCYAGPTSCPSSGPGAPAGTIMSYCNIKGCPTAGSQNVLQFHPTHINLVLLPAISTTITNQPGCLNTTDDIFYSGFE